MASSSTAIVWFRNDLRLSDNPALSHAVSNHKQVIPVYIHAPEEAKPWQPGEASNWWLHESLGSLQASLNDKGSFLHIESGNSLETLQRLINEYQADAIYWNRLYEPAHIERDTRLKKLFTVAGVKCQSFNSHLLNEPHQIENKAGKPFKVFSAYWRNASSIIDQLDLPLPAPQKIHSAKPASSSKTIDDLNLLPEITWYKSFTNHWNPGEHGAHQRLGLFLENILSGYKHDRDIPSVDGTSKLSAHLHFGEISPAQIIHTARTAADSGKLPYNCLEKFFAEIGWREFGYYLLYHFPESSLNSLDKRFDQQGWIKTSNHEKLLKAWQQGKTGIPIVDAGMRELWQTGYMHNRVRMICASILTKNMGFHWLEGARWFWDTLVDADLASNTLGWQWTAGCGVDAAPYFRIFSPPRQTERFDPEGEYIKHWIPELAEAERRFLIYGLPNNETGFDYPEPLIDLAESRKAALARWDNIRHYEAEIAV